MKNELWEQLKLIDWLNLIQLPHLNIKDKKQNKTKKACDHKKTAFCFSRQWTERFVSKLQAEENSVTKDHALQRESNSDVRTETIESGLARQIKGLHRSIKVWEHVHTEIWYTQDTIMYWFVDCLLKGDSIMRCWMVTIILDLSVNF